jgi:hypothetical protein
VLADVLAPLKNTLVSPQYPAILIVSVAVVSDYSSFSRTQYSPDLKYFVKLGRQNGIHVTVSSMHYFLSPY